MNCKIGKFATLCAAFALVFVFASTASAQVFTGRIDVTLEDTTGGRLPGVSVDLTGPVNQNQVSDANGEAHFLNLPVGIYTVKATLSGFNEFTNANVQVATGAATPIAVKMGVAGTSETVNVTAATPIIDVKRETTTTNVTLEELQNIPSARDPWVVMQTVPTIYVDRVNVGGSESGQQSNYIGKGTTTAREHLEPRWRADHGYGRDRLYADLLRSSTCSRKCRSRRVARTRRIPHRAWQLNLVLKKGSNTPHGNASTYFENETLQATNIPDDLVATLGGTGKKGNRTDKYLDSASTSAARF